MKRLGIVLSILTAVTLLLCGTALAYSATLKPVEAPTVVRLNADVIFTKVNDERAKNGLKPLVRDARLDATAQARADDMFTRNYFSHYDPITGKSMVLIKQTNPQCSEASENIGFSYDIGDNNQKQLDWWLNSKPHHDAILSADNTLTGVAVHGKYVVQHFCVAK